MPRAGENHGQTDEAILLWAILLQTSASNEKVLVFQTKAIRDFDVAEATHVG